MNINTLPAPEDCGPFHLPMQGLYADLDMGSGSVCLPDAFVCMPPSLQAEVLQDWMLAMEALRRRALVQIFNDMSARMARADFAERVAAFGATCDDSGLDVPPDVVAMLRAKQGMKA